MANRKRSMAVRMLREWHFKFGVPVVEKPTIPAIDRRKLRVDLINEEFIEFVVASGLGEWRGERLLADPSLTDAADALADLLYVIYGAALEWGIPIDEVFAEVHRSNMSKVWEDGTVHYRDDGKVLKPPTYSPADVAGVLAKVVKRKHTGELLCRACVETWLDACERSPDDLWTTSLGGPPQCTPLLFSDKDYRKRDRFIKKVKAERTK